MRRKECYSLGEINRDANSFKVVESAQDWPQTPYIKEFSKCWLCNRTRQPYAEYLPKRLSTGAIQVEGNNHIYKSFNFRFEIMLYALACYPIYFSRMAVMVNTCAHERTQTRILKSLVREGFLVMRQTNTASGLAYRLVPEKLQSMQVFLNQESKHQKAFDKYKHIPVVLENAIEIKSGVNEVYQQISLRFDVRFNILVYAAACNKTGFTRAEIINLIPDTSVRKQQRILRGLTLEGFLDKLDSRPMDIYTLNTSRFTVLKRLLSQQTLKSLF